MKQKKQEIKEVKTCGICVLPIVLGEEYCDLIQYDRDWKHFKTGSYHVKCFKERYLTNKIVEKKALEMLGKTNQMLNNVMGERA